MKELNSRLSLAARHIAEAQAIITRQHERVAEITKQGRLTPDTQSKLDKFVETLNILREKALSLQQELDGIK